MMPNNLRFVQAIATGAIAITSPPLLGGLFDWLSPPLQSKSDHQLECGDRYENPTYLSRAQIGLLEAGQYRFWSDIGQPFCRVLRDSASEWYYFPTAFKPELGVVIESDPQAVLLSWEFSIEEMAIAPEFFTSTAVADPPPLPPPEASSQQPPTDCIPYP